MDTKLIFIHRGYSDHLHYTLRQAVASNPETEVVLIGDADNAIFDMISHVDMSDFQSGAAEFAQVYKHMSHNNYDFELICFQRWFILEEYMRKHGLDEAFTFDSDVMIYSDLREYAAMLSFAGCNGIASLPRGSLAPHVIYWRLETLSRFTAFLLESYTNGNSPIMEKYERKWRIHVEQRQAGGVCDMTALLLFYEAGGMTPYVNLLDEACGGVFDHNINVAENLKPEEFAMVRGKKHIAWRDGVPCGLRVGGCDYLPFHALHFQGHAKLLLDNYYRGGDFPVRASLLNTAARRRLKGRLRRMAAYFVKLICGKDPGQLYFP